MTIQEFIEKDPRIQEMKKRGQAMVNQKNQLIMEISHIEADIIKLMGQFESLQKEIIGKVEEAMKAHTAASEPAPVDPGDEAEVAEENQDDGFAEAGLENPADFNDMEPSAENTNPGPIEIDEDNNA